jgi:hypothetical protein
MRPLYGWLIASLLPHPSFELIHGVRNIIKPTTRIFVDKRRFAERSSRQEERIYELEELETRTSSQDSELEGLKQKTFVEQYDPAAFSETHRAFKDSHNHVFAALCRYCECGCPTRNVFFLDGQDAGTASTLSKAEISFESCYVANRHESTCQVLKEFGLNHIAHGSAKQVLSSIFHNIPFSAYYFDGCGGHPPILIDMLQAALDETRTTCEPPIAIGVSIVGGNRDVVDKELKIVQALVKLAKARGLRVEHVLDDCERYGITQDFVAKVEGNTMTTWLLLVKDVR